MSDVLTKIEKLIALAASDKENEARNAAYQACRLIREHKVQLTLDARERLDPNGEAYDDIVSQGLDWLEKISKVPYRGSARASCAAHAQHATGPTRVYPFDPFTAPFAQVQAFLKTRSIDLHDNGDGSYSASAGFTSARGTWEQVVRFAFSEVESRVKRERGARR